MDLVGPVGPDDQQSLGPGRARDEGDDVAGRAVRPVEVLDDEQDRLPLPEPVEDAENRLQHPCLHPVRAGRRVACVDDATELRDEAPEGRTGRADNVLHCIVRQLPGQGSQGVGDRGERQTLVVAETDRGSLEDGASVVACDPAELPDETALADPGFATDEDGRRMAGNRCLPR